MPSLNSPALAGAMGAPVKKDKSTGYVGSKFVGAPGNSGVARAAAPGQIKKAAPIAKTLPTIGGPTITDRMATPQMPMKNPISSLVKSPVPPTLAGGIKGAMGGSIPELNNYMQNGQAAGQDMSWMQKPGALERPGMPTQMPAQMPMMERPAFMGGAGASPITSGRGGPEGMNGLNGYQALKNKLMGQQSMEQGMGPRF